MYDIVSAREKTLIQTDISIAPAPSGRSGLEAAGRAAGRLLPVLLSALLAGCGGGGSDGGDAGGDGGGQSGPAPDSVQISGRVTFDLVPAVVGGPTGARLDYASTDEAAPARAVTVELLSGDGQTVLDTAVTDAGGRFALTAEPGTDVFLRARAEMVSASSPVWDFRVVDNTQANAPYVLDGSVFDTGTASSTRNLHAGSGWGGAGYTGVRAAAPFAILDVVYESAQVVLSVDAAAEFPPLVLHWSPANVPTVGDDGRPDPASGNIGTSFFSSGFFSPGFGIFLLGAENKDTDEYDRHVIAHEWGHYFEHAFSRSDSIGGPHTFADQLDLRVAFGEGWGNALSAIVTGQAVYRDVFDELQGFGFGFDIEGESNPNPGWYSEQSVHEILFDLFDGTVEDAVELGLGPLYDVLTNQQRNTPALTSLYPFINALKAAQPQWEVAIDGLVGEHDITMIDDDYGDGETNAGHPPNKDVVLPIYRDIAVNDPGPAVNVCSTDEYESSVTGSVNKLASRQFLRFSVGASDEHTITVTATDVPDGEIADPDFLVHRRGARVAGSVAGPTIDCTTATPELCRDSATATLAAGDYVLEVYEWTNTNSHDSDDPPIGRTCFDVKVTQP